MRLANLRFFAITILTAAVVVTSLPQSHVLAATEYFTDEEIDFIREAQGISLRVPAIIQLANIRFVYLGMKEKTKEDKALENRIAELHVEMTANRNAKTPAQTSKGPSLPPIFGIPIPLPKKDKDKPEIDAAPYLTDLNRTELLKGYVQAIEN